jgi:hypothetical protein
MSLEPLLNAVIDIFTFNYISIIYPRYYEHEIELGCDKIVCFELRVID